MPYNNLRSPGVQITEKDLSLRSNFAPGTNIVVPGFASQGPTSEPIFISTASELENVYGIPNSPAEKYFYNTCREILNSAGSLVTIRLPYGLSAGSGFSQNYSALFYPMYQDNFEDEQSHYDTLQSLLADIKNPATSATTLSTLNTLTSLTAVTNVTAPVSTVAAKIASTSLSAAFFTNLQTWYSTVSADLSEWIIDSPIHYVLTEDEYVALQDGNYEWETPSGDLTKTFYTNGGEYFSQAGFFILNSLQTTINEVGEGFYVGLVDNAAVKANSPNFDSIRSLKSLNSSVSSTTSFNNINTNRLDFSLSSTVAESTKGVDSISETLEKVGFIGFETDEYQDHLSLGIFRIRRSISNAAALTIGSVEKYIGSFDYTRKQTNLAGGSNAPSAFIEDIINENSSTVKIHVNKNISKAFDWTGGTTLPTTRVSVSNAAKCLFPIGSYVRTIQADEVNKVIGEVPLKLDKALRFIESTESQLVDIIIDAGLSNVYSVTKFSNSAAFNEDLYIENPMDLYEDWKSVTDIFVNFAEKVRKDCVSIIDLPKSIFIQGKNTKVINIAGKNFTSHIYNYMRDFVGTYESNYAVTYGNWVKVNDIFTGRKIWLPFSGFAAAVFANTDANTFPWAAPAGLNRGIFNVIDIAFNPNQKQRDRLYEISVNPVVFFSGDGFAIMGQKTLQTKPTAFDRINVRRLFLVLERATQRALKYFVFEPNTSFTRTRLKGVIEPLFEYAKNTEGVYDFLIVCDERNNLPFNIDNNELIVDIYLKPVRTAEFILVNFVATRTGQNFAELL